MKKPSYVVDSYALMAYLGDEVGAEQVKTLLRQAQGDDAIIYLSLINLGEVAYIIERRYGSERLQEVLAILAQLPINPIEASFELVLAAAHVKAQHAVSYADTFAIALAQEKGAPVVTGDPEFKKVEHLVQVVWL
ncbi:MAG: type II toxin-antitoxin system VapC family toxin [Anaerolineae bacterium]